jgi:hypothetical protein
VRSTSRDGRLSLTRGVELAGQPREEGRGELRHAAAAGGSWGPALLRAAAILVLSWAGFLLIPDRLLAYLSTRVTPHSRDALVSAWVVIWFLALSWVFVKFQERGSS